MKKLFAWILAICVLFAFAACGGGGGTEEPKPTSGNNKPAESPNAEDVEGLEAVDTELFSLWFDPDVWVYDEEDLSDDEEYAEILLGIPGEEDDYIATIEISAEVDDAENFRDYLYNYDFDLKEYAVNNSYETKDIGGVACLTYEGEYWGEPYVRYFGRVEGAGLTVHIEVSGEYEAEDAELVLNKLEFLYEDTGNEDFPWPWDGEPFSAETAIQYIGEIEIESHFLPMAAEGYLTRETFDHAIAVDGDKVYILGDCSLRQYTYGSDGLTLEATAEVSENYDSLQVSTDGKVWMSGFGEDLIVLQNGEQIAAYQDTDTVTMAPDGTWGINWFTDPECEKITISGNTLNRTPITFSEVDTVFHLMIDDSYIYVCGTALDESGHKVFIYDHSGNLKLTLADENGEGLGSISFIAETTNGFIGLDGNMRDVIMWSADGAYIGDVSDGDLFGTGYPWFCSGAQVDDGTILMILTDDRADQSAMELIAFELTGL